MIAIVYIDNCCCCVPVIVGVVCTDYQLLLVFKNNGACCAPIIVIVCTQIYCYWLAVYAPNIGVIDSDAINCCCRCAPIGCGCVVCSTDYQLLLLLCTDYCCCMHTDLLLLVGCLCTKRLLCTDWVWLIIDTNILCPERWMEGE